MEARRDTVLTVTQREHWADFIEKGIGRLEPKIIVRRATTKESALAIIAQDVESLQAVISERSLTGTVGNEGAEITKAAIDAGVPHAAILSADPEDVHPNEGVDVWFKGHPFDEKLRSFLNL